MTIEEKREKNRLKNQIWRARNRLRFNQCVANYRKKYPERIKDYKLKIRYGISSNDYDKMFQTQDGKCAICGNPETATHNFSKNKQSLAVDHCHKTGKVRGLLCQDCNRGIAKFHEEVLRLQGAIEYLKIHA